MPEFTQHAPGSPCWVDLASPDVDASKSFYTTVFGWEAEDLHDDEGNRIYVMFRQNGKDVAGLGGQAPGMEGMPPVWNTYVAVTDPAATASTVTANGGSVIAPPMQVMDAGEMAVFADPTGAAFSVWKPGRHIGSQICNEPDTYAWNELMSRDITTARDFYSKVFGWKYDVMDMGEMGEYSVITGGENGGWGGMMAMPPDVPDMVPNHWAVYFTVSDIEATVAKVKAAGGQLVDGPFPAESVGLIAILHDPTGASFHLLQPASQS
jgi:predicted enzyme related to lactoylglutathione lyase